MEDVQWNSKVPLVTMETEGSNCFNEALKAGKIVTLNGINRSVYVLKLSRLSVKYLIFRYLGILIYVTLMCLSFCAILSRFI